MKDQKLFFLLILTFTFFNLVSTNATAPIDLIGPKKCKPLLMLNQSTKSHLHLGDQKMKIVQKINEDYWKARRKVLSTPEMLGQNTALLDCWDRWRLTLKKHLTEKQMEQFMKWQSNVDLLGKQPF